MPPTMSFPVARSLRLLSCFSRVQLCVTPQTAAHQAPPSLRFSRQEHWSGLPFPSPMHENESEAAQSCPTLSDPMDCSPPGSSIHGIFQARVLEWGAIAFFGRKILGTSNFHSPLSRAPGKEGTGEEPAGNQIIRGSKGASRWR